MNWYQFLLGLAIVIIGFITFVKGCQIWGRAAPYMGESRTGAYGLMIVGAVIFLLGLSVVGGVRRPGEDMPQSQPLELRE